MATMANLYKRIIINCYGKIYALGDAGLDYMDRHEAMLADDLDVLMQHVYNDELDTVSTDKLRALADALQVVVYDAEFDLEQA
jgi:hypothetical protein